MSEGADRVSLQGELQRRVMRVLWDSGEARVEDVRAALGGPSAYTTIQTVLNRLAGRGLVERVRSGPAYLYRAAVSEADFLSTAFSQVLDDASEPARRLALSRLVEKLDREELDEARRLADEARRRREGPLG